MDRSDEIRMSTTFVNSGDVVVWCDCGKQNVIGLPNDKNTWTEVCPKCGEVSEFTFIFRTVKAGRSPEEVSKS